MFDVDRHPSPETSHQAKAADGRVTAADAVAEKRRTGILAVAHARALQKVLRPSEKFPPHTRDPTRTFPHVDRRPRVSRLRSRRDLASANLALVRRAPTRLLLRPRVPRAPLAESSTGMQTCRKEDRVAARGCAAVISVATIVATTNKTNTRICTAAAAAAASSSRGEKVVAAPPRRAASLAAATLDPVGVDGDTD